jgi:hypothetical protein
MMRRRLIGPHGYVRPEYIVDRALRGVREMGSHCHRCRVRTAETVVWTEPPDDQDVVRDGSRWLCSECARDVVINLRVSENRVRRAAMRNGQ